MIVSIATVEMRTVLPASQGDPVISLDARGSISRL